MICGSSAALVEGGLSPSRSHLKGKTCFPGLQVNFSSAFTWGCHMSSYVKGFFFYVSEDEGTFLTPVRIEVFI